MPLREVALLALHMHITTYEHRNQNSNVIKFDLLSSPTQTLLYVLDLVQPTNPRQSHAYRITTIDFTPTAIDYNSLRLQAQPYSIDLMSPHASHQGLTFSIQPPILRTDKRGDEEWKP
jgi:hypothetical protein